MTLPSLPRRLLFGLGAPLALLAGCSPSRLGLALALDGIDQSTPAEGYRLLADQAFGPGPRQRLDLYVPEGACGAPVVVFWYGGGWRTGGRKQYRFVAEALTRRGLVVALPDYRLSPEASWPAFVEDGAAAAVWVERNVAVHGGDPSRIVLSGHSAGGHTAHVLALDPRWLERAGGSRARIACVATISGVTGFERLEGPRWGSLFADADPPGSHLPARLASAGAPGAPPFLLLAGEDDRLVPAANTQRLARAIRDAGGSARAVVYPGDDHLTVMLGLSSRFAGERRLADDLAGFVTDPPRRG